MVRRLSTKKLLLTSFVILITLLFPVAQAVPQTIEGQPVSDTPSTANASVFIHWTAYSKFLGEYEAIEKFLPINPAECKDLLSLIGRSSLYYATHLTQIKLDPTLNQAFAQLHINMALTFNKYCRHNIDDLDGDGERGVDFIDMIREHLPTTGFDDIGITDPFNTRRFIDPGDCFPTPTTLPPHTTVLPPPNTNPFLDPDFQVRFLLISLGVATAALGGYLIIMPIVAGCTTSALTATTVPALVTSQTAASIYPLITQRVAAGIAPVAIGGALAEATTDKNENNPGFNPHDPSTWVPLTEAEATAALQALTLQSNPYYQQLYDAACNKAPLCPQPGPTTGGPGGVPLTGGIPITPTSSGNSCNPTTLRGEILPTTTGSKHPKPGRLGEFYDVLKLYLQLSPEFQEALSELDLDFDFNDPNGLQEILFAAFNTNYQIATYQSPYTPLEYAFDLTDACEKNPGKKVYFGMRFKFKAKACSHVYMTFFGYFDCPTAGVGSAGPGVVFTGPRGTPPNIPQTLKGLVGGDLKNPTGKPPTTTLGGPVTGVACSGELCTVPGKPSCATQGPNAYCNAACVCEHRVCGNRVVEPGEECDPTAIPNGCPNTHRCTSTCSCQKAGGSPISGIPTNPGPSNPKNPVNIVGSGTPSLNSPSASTQAVILEEWDIVTGDPSTNAIITYSNDHGETATITLDKQAVKPLTIKHLDGTTSTYNYQNNKLHSIVNTAGNRRDYSYKNGELDTVQVTDNTGYQYDLSFQYVPDATNTYTYIDVTSTYGSTTAVPASFKTKTILREETQPASAKKELLPYSKKHIQHITAPDGSFEDIMILQDDIYLTIIRRFYHEDGSIKQVDKEVDVNTDGIKEYARSYVYNYDAQGRVDTITTSDGATYTYTYSGSDPTDSLLSVTDNWGKSIGKARIHHKINL